MGNKKAAANDYTRAYAAGKKANRDDLSPDHNPHKTHHDPAVKKPSRLRDCWMKGFYGEPMPEIPADLLAAE